MPGGLGGAISGARQVWQDAFVDYLLANDAPSYFYWCVNPNSGNTGVLLKSDWRSVNMGKLELLQPRLLHDALKGTTCGSAISTTTRREYVITTPNTPYPWINYLGSEHFFSLVSHRAGGYCFYRDARLRRLTRYRYNNVPTDVGGRYFYINDGGERLDPGFAAGQGATLDAFECRHGLGYTRITGERKRRPRRAAVLRAARPRPPRSTSVTLKNTSRRREDAQALLVRRVLPVERATTT